MAFPFLDLAIVAVRVANGRQGSLNSDEKRLRQKLLKLLDETQSATRFPEIRLRRGRVEEAEDRNGNVQRSDGLVEVEVVGIAGTRGQNALGGSAAGIGKCPDAIGYGLLEFVVVDAESQEGRGDVESQRFGRAWVDLAEEGRRNEGLRVCFENVGDQLVGQLLRGLARLDIWRRLAQGKEDIVFAD